MDCILINLENKNTQWILSIYENCHRKVRIYRREADRKGHKKSRQFVPGLFNEIKIQSLRDFHQRNGTLLRYKRSFPEPECFSCI